MSLARFAVFLGVLLALTLPAGAQGPDTLAAARVRSERDIPLIRASEQSKIGQAASTSMNMADMMRRFTGVQVKDYGGAGGLKTVNVRSLGSEHVGVFVDGIQIDNAQNMQVDLGRISVGEADDLSLYVGPLSRRLQTAKEYAAGASVHIDTAFPSTDELKVKLLGVSMGTINPMLGWKKRFGHYALEASAEYLGSNGKYPYNYFDTTLVRENDDIRSLRLDTRLFGSQERGDWRVLIHAYGSERGFPGPVVRRALGFPLSAERQADQDLSVQGTWKQEWTSSYASAIRFKYLNSYTHYSTHPEKNPMAAPYDLHYRQQSFYFSVAQSLALSSAFSADFSLDYHGNALDSDAGAFAKPVRNALTAALAGRMVMDKIRIAVHLVYQGVYDRFLNPHAGGWKTDDSWRDGWMPSLSLSWEPLPWFDADIFVKRTFRMPSFNDLYYTLMGNSGLSPESALQLGSDLHVHWKADDLRGEVRLSPYFNRVSDKIVAIPTASQFRWTMLNIGIADITGLDFKAETAYRRGEWSLEAIFRYSFQQALDHSTPGSMTYGNQIPYIPLHSGSVDLNASLGKWSLTWNTVLTGERWSRSANTADYHIDPWSISDVELGRQLLTRDGGMHLTLSLRFSNIFDVRYQIVQGYPMPGRTFLAALTLLL